MIEVYMYNESSFSEEKVENADLESCIFLDTAMNSKKWLNIEGLNDGELADCISRCFKLHPLVLEDVQSPGQRPKIEDYGDYLYIVAKMLYHDAVTGEAIMEQQSIIIGRDYLISIGEKEGDVFDSIRSRLRNGSGRIRNEGTAYLAYCLLDAIVDNYFTVLEKFGDEIEEVEEIIVKGPQNPATLKNVHRLKREMLYIHKAIWPLREVCASLVRDENPLIDENSKVYIRDVYDHIVQAMDTTETYRDMLSGILDIYLSSTSNKLNEVMKVLTVISTIFIPLTFIVGLYGMNFRNMPELTWKWGYFAIVGLMVVIAMLMVVYFKKKKWF